mgnify:CR=1 FL=1
MQKTTVLANLRFTIEFTGQTLEWFGNFPNAWFAREGGANFLSEFGGTWKDAIVPVVESEIREYFSGLGLPQDHLPYIQQGETYRGSWIFDAAVVMAGTVGTAYTVLKAVSELPEIADGLTQLKDRILKKLKPRVNREVSEKIYKVAQDAIPQRESPPALATHPEHPRAVPPPPTSLVIIDLVIDARPLRSLTPAVFKSHKIHLSVAVSRDSFTLENLGDDPLRDVRIGLFRTRTERHQWAYQDSYMGNFPLVSSRQTVAKNLGEFIDRAGNRFDLSDGDEVYVDCWVEDSHGIYLFRFFLEKEW